MDKTHSPFLSKSWRPSDPPQHDPTIHQIADHELRTANHIAQSTTSFLCTIMLRIIIQNLTRPLGAPVNQSTFCDSCSIEKQARKPIPHIAESHLDNDHLKPGDKVSYGQFESSLSGLKSQNLEKATTKRYTCGSVFVDHSSRYVFLQLHHSTGATEALQGKHNFKRLTKGSGVTIKVYLADNGIFAKTEIQNSAKNQGQVLTFSGGEAHHQNGIAKRYIHTLTERSRMMLLHVMVRWPEHITTSFWTFVISYAVQIHNTTPLDCGLTQEEIFTGQKGRGKMDTFHTFGCPSYVLNPALQGEHNIPKWQPR
jgi:hypothetical protein